MVHWVVSKVRKCLDESTRHLTGFASRWSVHLQSGLQPGIRLRVLQSCLLSQCASPHSRSARPFTSCQSSGLRKRERSFRNGASGMLNLKSTSQARTAPRPASMSCSFLTPHSSPPCRLQSHRLKWNLFDDRPLFHLTRCLLRRPRVVLFRLSPKQTSFASR